MELSFYPLSLRTSSTLVASLDSGYLCQKRIPLRFQALFLTSTTGYLLFCCFRAYGSA